MPNTVKNARHVDQIKRLLLETEMGLTPTQLAKTLCVDRSTVHPHLKALGEAAENLGDGVYRYHPTNEDIDLALLILQRHAQRDRC